MYVVPAGWRCAPLVPLVANRACTGINLYATLPTLRCCPLTHVNCNTVNTGQHYQRYTVLARPSLQRLVPRSLRLRALMRHHALTTVLSRGLCFTDAHTLRFRTLRFCWFLPYYCYLYFPRICLTAVRGAYPVTAHLPFRVGRLRTDRQRIPLHLQPTTGSGFCRQPTTGFCRTCAYTQHGCLPVGPPCLAAPGPGTSLLLQQQRVTLRFRSSILTLLQRTHCRHRGTTWLRLC